MSLRQASRLFQHVTSQPNPNANPALWKHRQKQWRPLSRNPFEPKNVSDTGYGLTTIDSPSVIQHPALDSDKSQPSDKNDGSSQEELTGVLKNQDMERGEQIPSWLNLFYDLAWTATFSSLTSNNKFREPWDSVSYVAFFIAAWWLWVSQLCYNIDFYTDDWFHLLFIFLQLVTFGALAATTRGFDVRNYITQSPGSEELKTYNVMTMTPDEYGKDRLTKISLQVITFVIAISRVLLLIQHLRVLIYSKRTSKSGRFPRQLLIVPVSLVVSTGLFFGAFAISKSDSGKESHGAKIRLVLCGAALAVEMVAHAIRSQMDISQEVELRSHGSIQGRLNDITTIILGEGINTIAGTFYMIEQTPGFSKSVGVSILCCGVIVFFLAYLYFEGAAPLKSIRRRAAWVIMHLPWLLSVILLLEGVKNQLLLLGFLGTTSHVMIDIADAWIGDPDKFNSTMGPLLLKVGLSFEEQYRELDKMINSNTSTIPDLTEERETQIINEIGAVWYLRVQILGALNTYKTFMDTDNLNDTIPETTSSNIQKYLTDYNFTLEDVTSAEGQSSHFLQLLEDLTRPSVGNARYIMALCGATFICLASLNLIQSWPRDRFHWASIFSRYAMGICMLLLLLLNLGKYKGLFLATDQEYSQQAGVPRWIDAAWVLPTLALAYVIQFGIDTILLRYAVRSSKRVIAQTAEPEKLT